MTDTPTPDPQRQERERCIHFVPLERDCALCERGSIDADIPRSYVRALEAEIAALRSAPVGERERELEIDRDAWKSRAEMASHNFQRMTAAVHAERERAIEEAANVADGYADVPGEGGEMARRIAQHLRSIDADRALSTPQEVPDGK